MSVRNTILKAIADTAENSAQGAKRAKPKNRKMPRQGAKYDVQDIYRTPAGIGWNDGQGRLYKRYTIGGKSYMRRSDGVWYKPMREGTWSSMLSPPKGGEGLHQSWQVAKGAGAAAAGGVAANEVANRFRK